MFGLGGGSIGKWVISPHLAAHDWIGDKLGTGGPSDWWKKATEKPLTEGAGSTISPMQEATLKQYLENYGPESGYGQNLMALRTSMMGYNPTTTYDPNEINTRFDRYQRPEYERTMGLVQDKLDQGFAGSKGKNYFSTGRARAKTELGSNLASQYNRQLSQMHDTGMARSIAAAEAARGRQMTMAQLDPAKNLTATSTQQPYAVQGESPLEQAANIAGIFGSAGKAMAGFM